MPLYEIYFCKKRGVLYIALFTFPDYSFVANLTVFLFTMSCDETKLAVALSIYNISNDATLRLHYKGLQEVAFVEQKFNLGDQPFSKKFFIVPPNKACHCQFANKKCAHADLKSSRNNVPCIIYGLFTLHFNSPLFIQNGVSPPK